MSFLSRQKSAAFVFSLFLLVSAASVAAPHIEVQEAQLTAEQIRELGHKIHESAENENPESSALVQFLSKLNLKRQAINRIRAYHLEHATQATNGHVPGLALVTPSTIKKAEVAAATHLLRVSPAPLLGLVTYTPPRSPLQRVLRSLRREGGRDGRR